MDFSSFYFSIAGCSATIIAIIGGFIASKLISISADRDNILDRIKEINDELSMKTKQHEDIVQRLNDDDALDFIRDNIELLVDNRPLEVVYKPEEKPSLDYFTAEQYWKRALALCREIADLETNQMEDTNSDKVPVYLAKKYTDDFDYGVCKKVFRELNKRARQRNRNTFDFSNALIDVGDIVPPTINNWYHQKSDEAEKLETRIDELKFEKIQYEEKKKQVKKPRGMKSGLFLFIAFSILGVFFPLICVLVNGTLNSLCVAIVSLCLFGICVLITFIYMALLLRWKKVD
ncbi:hypothetical protein [Anaerosporobacter sp.]|uniref:hypothetical protein n=1 Tax=Anaerosporobacter sp. TaxID=1872529 RepID=UPI00286F4564|nr:hypothetical protein [Anaerosporobacter sp.]